MENSPGEMDRTLATLQAILIRLNWGQMFSLFDEIHRHMVIALQNPEIYTDKVKGVEEMSEGAIQCASCNTAVTFTDDNILLWSKPHNRPLFVTRYIRK